MRRLLLPLLLLAFAVHAQEPEEEAPPPHPSDELYAKALKLQRKGKWLAAKRAFERLIKKYPDSPHLEDADIRSDDNAYLGVTDLALSGPSERRIDVAVMGDGFTVATRDQRKQEKWADECVKVLWHEYAFGEYRNYFNLWFVRLASLEEGVDPLLTPEERKKIEERNKRRSRKKKTEYSTALDAKAAGPQGQVLMDRGLVYKWLDIANRERPGCGDDRFVIAFAQFGKLGMGGGGIANVGRPDKSITTHEFGHAFSRLLDEYAINPGSPRQMGAYARTIQAANAYAKEEEPSKDEVPWAHMLAIKRKGVGIFEGGATFKKGVWRPARTCAMNAAGATGFCPVCREQSILVIYEYVNPIDTSDPPIGAEVHAVYGDKTMIVVTPMQPRKHALEAEWFAQKLAPVTQSPAEPEPEDGDEEEDELTNEELRELLGLDGERRGDSNPFRGARLTRHRAEEYSQPPPGKPAPYGKSLKGKPRRLAFQCGKLPPGRYTVTVEVRDPTKSVVKDENHLLKERASWVVSVSPKE